jgi:hypothetical protein
LYFKIKSSSRASAIVLALIAVAVGGTFLVVGLALLAALAVAGALIGAGAIIYQRLTGRTDRFSRGTDRGRVQLPPELEVFPSNSVEERRSGS